MIVIADPAPAWRSRVADVLDGLDGLGYVENRTELDTLLAAREDDIEVVVLGPNMAMDVGLDTARRLAGVAAPVGVVAVAGDFSPRVLREAMKAGVRDVLPDDVGDDELRDAVMEARAQTRELISRDGTPPDTEAEEAGTVVTVFSSKGGCGKSVVACNLAILLSAATDDDVALVDLDLESGDLAIMLQVLPALTLYDAAEKLDRLDTEALAGYLAHHDAGVELLAAPPEPSLAGAVSGDAVRRILGLLRNSHPYVVIDSPASFTDQLLAGLDASDELVLVTTLDVPSVKNLKLSMETLDQLGWDRDRLRLVLNRADSQVGLKVKDVERTLGTTIDVRVPSSRDVPLSVNEGEPMAHTRPRSPVVAALGELVDQIHTPPTEPADASGPSTTERGLIRRLVPSRYR